jgi:hypothetical protein
MSNETDVKAINNITTEILLVGSLFKKPDLYVSWGNYIRSKYDFDDEVTRFYYDNFDLMYRTFSQTFDEVKVNAFMLQDSERLKYYKEKGGYKLLSEWISLADPDDFKNYFNIVKKYSLIREYQRNGFAVQKLLNHRKFNDWTPADIYKLIRAKADKISTVILANEESVILNDHTTKDIFGYLVKPQMGLEMPWKLLNEMFRGCRLGKMMLTGFLSGEGKSRNLMMLLAYITLIKRQKFLLLSNEMSEEDLKSCLITTVINNQEFQELHGVKISKPEKEIVLGQYRGIDGNFIDRKVDEEGNFIESEDEFTARVYQESEEFRKVLEVGKWIEDRKEGKIYFKDVGLDYDDTTLEFEIRKHNLAHNIKYFGYDNLKGFKTDNWESMKQTATRLKEVMKDTNTFLWAVFQLNDETVFTDIFSLSSNNIANSKAIKHVADSLILGKKLNQEDYQKYRYVSYDDWGVPAQKLLDPNKNYFALKVDKNRSGTRVFMPLMEYDLDLNIWACVGSLQRR